MNRERAPLGRHWVRVAAFAVLVASAVGAVAFLITAPSADCRTVRTTVSYIHEHRDLIADDQIDAGPRSATTSRGRTHCSASPSQHRHRL